MFKFGSKIWKNLFVCVTMDSYKLFTFDRSLFDDEPCQCYISDKIKTVYKMSGNIGYKCS